MVTHRVWVLSCLVIIDSVAFFPHLTPFFFILLDKKTNKATNTKLFPGTFERKVSDSGRQKSKRCIIYYKARSKEILSSLWCFAIKRCYYGIPIKQDAKTGRFSLTACFRSLKCAFEPMRPWESEFISL